MMKFCGVMLFLLVLCCPRSGAQCCQCKNNAGPFRVTQGGGSCRDACKYNNPPGAFTGVTGACFDYHKYPSAPRPNYDSCLKSVDGGDCKGNDWCTCKLAAFVRKGPENVHVGDEVAVHINSAGFGGNVSHTKTNRDELQSSMTVFWGDGTEDMLALGEKDATHKYAKAGTYTVSLEAWGSYHWSVDEGSCSYECKTSSAKTTGDLKFNVTEKEAPKPKAIAKFTH